MDDPIGLCDCHMSACQPMCHPCDPLVAQSPDRPTLQPCLPGRSPAVADQPLCSRIQLISSVENSSGASSCGKCPTPGSSRHRYGASTYSPAPSAVCASSTGSAAPWMCRVGAV